MEIEILSFFYFKIVFFFCDAKHLTRDKHTLTIWLQRARLNRRVLISLHFFTVSRKIWHNDSGYFGHILFDAALKQKNTHFVRNTKIFSSSSKIRYLPLALFFIFDFFLFFTLNLHFLCYFFTSLLFLNFKIKFFLSFRTQLLLFFEIFTQQLLLYFFCCLESTSVSLFSFEWNTKNETVV